MKTVLNIFFVLLTSFVLTSCWLFDLNPPDYAFPRSPVNFGDINSEYDDYNSAASPYEASPLLFSSNRNSSGGNFSIVYKLTEIYFHRHGGELTVTEQTNSNLSVVSGNEYLYNALRIINDQHNELGPYLIPQGSTLKESSITTWAQSYILMYASDESGNLDIKFTDDVGSKTYSDPSDVVFLNSGRDDAYPTITSDSSILYFCSDRDGNFNIYHTNLDRTVNLVKALSDSSEHVIDMDPVLSTSSNDKCPFIVGNLMVFTSDRPGGFGGFDLYYSNFENDEWSPPVNFGDKINTAYDEYRPIVIYFPDVSNDFMIFSSNRPGGKGGFDLYYVGIDKMTGFTIFN